MIKKVIKKLKLLFRFYKGFFLLSLIANIWFSWIIIENKNSIIVIVIMLKLTLNTIIALFLNSYKTNEFHYYQNLGLSKKEILIGVGVIDALFFSLFVFSVQKIKS